jgi:hypothetical protein
MNSTALTRELTATQLRSETMVKIDALSQAGRQKIRLQLTHKIETTELDEIPIVMREPLRRQPSVNRFADVYESLGLFTNIKHGGTPYEWKDKE